ncbi:MULTISPECIES: hypothetical protein [Streptomyces]|uniref:Uncharacterized protein n=1 Tax=Streptomyces dengpaensis TaxID=2049881 RepID=A0ABN5I3B3_9ACTN|nr:MULTISPECIES: hypothetical protein [Streptomyces]AVH57500.1 hypothetical protein C4B68_18885 [Streptomyces dengpaensis]PIB04128.1 hypothetical protein B1C81_34480 [Streptomyces sp. HG99]
METFATVITLLAMIALGALAIQLFTTSHSDRIATPPSGRSSPPGRGSGRTPARTVRSGLRRFRPWRRTGDE